MGKRGLIIALCTLFLFAGAQENTATTTQQTPTLNAKHNIKLATTLALIPGAGQVYNKKYWKVPIVWGALGGTAYYYSVVNGDFYEYRDVLQFIIDNPDLMTRTELEAAGPEVFSAVPSPFYQTTRNGVADEAMGYMDQLRSQREYAFFAIFVVYGISILDANIDAHLYDFDVSDDLTLQPTLMLPDWTTGRPLVTPGIKLTYSLK